MRIAVLVKQVPATENVKIDEATGTMIREGVEAELNPLDLHAVEEAVRIKERLGKETEITVVSMGPRGAEKAVRSALAMGCDRGVLLSDRKFAGSDTLATARTLAAGLQKRGGFDLVLSGERATDGETGQVGPAVGRILGYWCCSFRCNWLGNQYSNLCTKYEYPASICCSGSSIHSFWSCCWILCWIYWSCS